MRLTWFIDYTIHLRIILVLSLLQKFSVKPPKLQYQELFQHDIELCPNCFVKQIEKCSKLFKRLGPTTNNPIIELINNLYLNYNKRHIQWLKLKQTNEIILAKTYKIQRNYELINKTNRADKFLKSFPKLGSFNYCALLQGGDTIRLVNYFKEHLNHTEDSIWFYMQENITPLLMMQLQLFGFPVPQVHGVCGFTIFQSNAGHTLSNYYKADFRKRLQIAKQLLNLALRFSYGFGNFRIYITDLTADNLAYDEIRQQLTIIDLDTVVIVDAGGNKQKEQEAPHRHIIIPSSNGFAFQPHEFCKYQLYDVNIYEACQMLYADLSGNRQQGFLFYQESYEEIIQSAGVLEDLLALCVACPVEKCTNRFGVAQQLMVAIDEILIMEMGKNSTK